MVCPTGEPDRFICALGTREDDGIPATVTLESKNSCVTPNLTRPTGGEKGTTSNLGALGMARICEQIRAAGKATAFERVSSLRDELEQEFERERAQLS